MVRPFEKQPTGNFVSPRPPAARDKAAMMYYGSPTALPYLEEPIEASGLIKVFVREQFTRDVINMLACLF